MPGESRFIGKNVTPEEHEKLSEWHEGIIEKYSRPLEGETEKTEEKRRFLERLNDYYAEEFQELGLSEQPRILLEQIHILPSEVYDRRFPGAGAGFHSTVEDQIFTTSWRKKENLYFGLIHEGIHALSHHTLHAELSSKGGFVKTYRSGYQVTNPESREHRHLAGFDEAITEKMARDIFKKHRQELVDNFDYPADKEPAMPMLYGEYMEILDGIIEVMAEHSGEDPEDVWRQFKRGKFTGEMMHLRNIERTFGEGSLRVLAALDYKQVRPKPETVILLVKEYFMSTDTLRRKEIAKTLLSDPGYRQYRLREKRAKKYSK